jgi:hypothetical protein
LYKRGYVLKESDRGNFIVHKETGTKMFNVYIEGGVFKVKTSVIKNQVYATSTSTAQKRPSADKSEEADTDGRREDWNIMALSQKIWSPELRQGHQDGKEDRVGDQTLKEVLHHLR